MPPGLLILKKRPALTRQIAQLEAGDGRVADGPQFDSWFLDFNSFPALLLKWEVIMAFISGGELKKFLLESWSIIIRQCLLACSKISAATGLGLPRRGHWRIFKHRKDFRFLSHPFLSETRSTC
jgi:hypothetical protein